MKFTQEAWTKLLEKSVEKINQLSLLKGGEYAGDDDRLANFRRNADQAGTSMEFVWRIYAAKHWDAIMQYERDLREGKHRERLESIDGRIDDLIVYLLLFKAMHEERTTPPAIPHMLSDNPELMSGIPACPSSVDGLTSPVHVKFYR